MIDQRKLEEMVRDMTIGSGDVEVSVTNLVEMVWHRTGERPNPVQERIIARALRQCQMEMEMP